MGAVAAAAAKIRTSDIHYLSLLPGECGYTADALAADVSVDRSMDNSLLTKAHRAGGKARHSVVGPGETNSEGMN